MDDIRTLAQIAGHRARNRALLEAIDAHGASLDSPKPIDFAFNVKRKPNAERLASELTSLGFEKISLSRSGWFVFSTWSIKAVLTASPNDVAADAFVTKLVRLATENDAIFDGWGMELG